MSGKTRKQTLLEFLQADPEDSFSRYALGLECLAGGDLEGAVEALAELRRRNPDYVALYYQLGKALKGLGRREEAREAWLEGQQVARKARDWHTHDELQGVLDGLE